MVRLLQFALAMCGIMLFVTMLGCSGASGPTTVPAKGTLTIDGTPANNISITLSPLDANGVPATGVVNNGAFGLTTGSQGKPGAVPGKYKVVLAAAAGGQEAAMAAYAKMSEAKRGKQSTAPKEEKLPFPAKYKSAGTSDKQVEITSGSNDLKIEISSSGG